MAESTDLHSSTVTAEIVRRARGYAFAHLPADVVRLAKQCVLDWIGVTVAGAAEPAAGLVRAEVLDEAGAARATLLGTGERVALAQAALVNGTAAHALDYDDVSPAMSGHPSAAILPALLALAEDANASGQDLLTAFVVGFETACRVGRLVAPDHYRAGWHATGTVGTFGAAAACATMLRLDEAQWLSALGIAGTQAAGLKAMFGTMCKPLHAGKAAANGLLAARLAARGFTGNPAVLDVPQGFTATQTTSPNPDRALELGPGDYETRSVLFKFHASCYATHSSIEGVSQLVHQRGLAPQDVLSVELGVPPALLDACDIAEPATPLQGKFSVRFTTALALSGRRTDETGFTTDNLTDPVVLALRDRVRVTPVPELVQPFLSRVTVTTRGGDVFRAAVDVSKPTPVDGLADQWRKLTGKFVGLVEPALGPDAATGLVDAVATLEHCRSVRDVVRLASP